MEEFRVWFNDHRDENHEEIKEILDEDEDDLLEA
jgi:hypothetical protein